MDLGLQGRTALITGGSKGIGLATAQLLAKEGCRIVLVARDAGNLAEAASIVSGISRAEVAVEVADVAQDDTASRLAEKYSDLDILVNNAGAIPRGGLEEVDQRCWREGWDTKVFGMIGLTRSFYGKMKPRGRGVIVNVLGIAGERYDSDFLSGSTANAGLIAFTQSFGSVTPKYGIRVVGVSPGPVATERLDMILKQRAEKRFGDSSRSSEIEKEMPFGRAAKAEEIAATITFLASDISSYTSGAILSVDGGLTWRS